MRINKIVALLVVLLLLAVTGVVNAEKQNKDILSEASVWRSYTTWMPVVAEKKADGKRTKVYRNMEFATPPPPDAWVKPEFDDSLWSYWREPDYGETMKLKEGKRKKVKWARDGEDTGMTLYSSGQYGIRRSSGIALNSMRGKFMVSDPSKTSALTLSVQFRGGLVAYLNGVEIGRSYLPKGEKITATTVADIYPADVCFNAVQKSLKLRKVSSASWVLLDQEWLKLYNARIRTLDVTIPATALKKGVNVLALDIHRSLANAGDRGISSRGMCGLVKLRLKGSGDVVSSVGRPKGVHVWNINALARITSFGYLYQARVGNGASTIFERFPQSWGDIYSPLRPINIAGTRGGTFVGQVGVSSDKAIRGLKATATALTKKGGSGKIAATALDVWFTKDTDKPYDSPFSASIEGIDAMYNVFPSEFPVRTPVETKFWAERTGRAGGVLTWVDTGVALGIWVKVKIPSATAAGEYSGTLNITADGMAPVAVPISVRVADWVIPDPREWTTHVGTPHSLDTLAIHYNVPLWSEKHWALIEKTLAYMSEVGSKVIYIPLKARTGWLLNEESMVYWVKKSDGSFTYDYRVFDRYMDLVQKYLKPDVFCLYAVDFASGDEVSLYTLLDPATGKRTMKEGPEYKPTPEAQTFWKSLFDDVIARMKKRGVKKEEMLLGLAWEGGGSTGKSVNNKVDLFEKVVPVGMKLIQLAHYGGIIGARGGGDKLPIPFGYVMSVWGNRGKIKSTGFGSKNIPLNLVQHYRSGGYDDLRLSAPRGFLRVCTEEALKGTRGIGPLGMDFWHVPGDKTKGRKWPASTMRPLEGSSSPNLSMSKQSSGVFLHPGPDGPLPTVRFELFKEGLQECEARRFIEDVLADATKQGKLGAPLVKRCKDIIAERELMESLPFYYARGYGYGEGWKWYESSGWEDRAYKLFSCAGAVSKALGK